MSNNVLSLNTLSDLERVIALSDERRIFIYKHSSACPISSRTYRTYHDYADKSKAEAAPIFTEVFVIEHRDVSNAVADRLGVRHQSPQLLLLSKRKTVWNTSHFDITKESIDRALEMEFVDGSL